MTFLLALFAVQVQADEVTFNPSDFEEVSTAGDYTIKKSPISFTVSNGMSTEEFRIYKGATIKFTADNATITKIVFTCTANSTAKYGPGNFKTDNGYTYSGKTGTWSGSASEVTFTASGAQVRATSIVVTYTASNTPSKKETKLSFDNASYTFDQNSDDAKNFGGQVAKLTDADGNAVEGTVSYSSSDENIAVVDESNGDVALDESKGGTAKITAKYAGDDTYAASEAYYTITIAPVVTNFADFMETSGTAKVTLTNAQVLYVKNNNMFVRDAAGTAICFYKSSYSFEAGDIVSGSFYATYTSYKDLGPEAASIQDIDLTKSSNSTPEPVVVSAEEVSSHLCDLIKLENVAVTVSDSKYYVGSVQVYDKFGLEYTLAAGNYNIVGIGTVYNTSTYEICPTEAPEQISGKKATTLTLSETALSYTTDNYADFTAPTATVTCGDVTVADAAITFESDNTEVATVSEDGTVSLTGTAGTAAITATYAGDENYEGSTATYTVTVEGVVVEEAGIEFTFEQTSKTEGTLTNAPEGVTYTFVSGKDKDGNANGGIQKDQIATSYPMTLTLSNLPVGYKIAGITLEVRNNKSKGAGTAQVSLDETSIANDLSITGLKNTYVEKEVELTSTPTINSANEVLKVYISATESSAWCDKFIVKLVPTSAAEVKTLSSTATNWGTVCLPYTAQTVEGTTIYTVTGSSDEGIVVDPKEDGILVAGTPYVFKAEKEGSFYKASNDEVTEPVAGDNNLVGILADKTLTGDEIDNILILAASDGIWHLMGSGATVNFKANRAYLSALPNAVSEVKANYSIIGTDVPTAINGMNAGILSDAPAAIYTLAGQRVSSMVKGNIYIVNGKKVLVK